jgi:vacuolar-type H+-ATPase subunit F/Vma7
VSRAVAIGDERRLAGYTLAGVVVQPAASPAESEAAWATLDDDTGLLVLTPEAKSALEPLLAERDDLVWVVLPS